MTMPRFYFDNEPPQSVADRLLDNASQLEIKLLRKANGLCTAYIELHASVGADLFVDEDDDGADIDEQRRQSVDGLAYARQLLCAFEAGKDGAA